VAEIEEVADALVVADLLIEGGFDELREAVGVKVTDGL